MRILLVFLLFSANVNAQYKQFTVGMNYSTNLYYTKDLENWGTFPRPRPYRFSSYAVTLQYNLPSVLSVSLEPAWEHCSRNETDEINDEGPYEEWIIRYESRISDRFVLPLMVKTTLGNRFLFVPAFGVNCSVLLPSSRYEKVDYSIYDDFQEEPLAEINEKVSGYGRTEINVVWGIGFAYHVNEKLLFTLDSRFPINNLRYPEDRDSYSSYPMPRLIFSAAYQFNFKKNSDYKFSTYSLTFKKSTDGK